MLELEARIAARLVSGKLSLPSNSEMVKEATQDMEWRRKHWGEHSERVTGSPTSSIKVMMQNVKNFNIGYVNYLKK